METLPLQAGDWGPLNQHLAAIEATVGVTAYSAIADVQTIYDGAITTAQKTLTSATATFVPGDVGKSITVDGAAASATPPLSTTVAAYVDAHTVTLTLAASQTVTGATVKWGTDQTTAIQNAINICSAAGGGIVYFSDGQYVVNGTLTIPSKVTLRGAGMAGFTNRANGIPWDPVSGIVRLVGTGTMLKVGDGSAPVYSMGIEMFGVDCNRLANIGLQFDMVRHSRLRSVGIKDCPGTAFNMQVSGSISGIGNSWNTFDQVYLTSDQLVGTALHLNGNAGSTANCCHNTFKNLSILYFTTGILLDDCDNNGFYDTYISPNTSAGFAVDLGPKATSNYFFHLQPGNASLGGVRAQAPSNAKNANVIYGYDRQNAQPAPTIASGANLHWEEVSYNGTGVHLGAQTPATMPDALANALGYHSWNFPPFFINSSSAPAAGTIYVAAVYIPPGKVVNGIELFVATPASGTAPTLFKVGLASPTNLVAQSNDLKASATLTTFGIGQLALNATYVANSTDSPTGLYYVVLFQVGAFSVTQPAFARGNGTSGSGAALSGKSPFCGTTATAQSDLPANGTAITITPNALPWQAGVY